MSKKKTKKKAARAAGKPAKRTAARSLMSSRQAAPPTRTAAATIFVINAGGTTRVRTAPQRLPAGPGFIEWTIVNLGPDPVPDAEITWGPKGDPWGGNKPIPIKGGSIRVDTAGARDGVYKYSVTVNGVTEDPEIEIPWN